MNMQAADYDRKAIGDEAAEQQVHAPHDHDATEQMRADMNRDDFQLLAEQGDPAESDRAIRFAYQGGARPLDGYAIKRGIGRGGFGEVYYAVSDAGKEVALKLIRRNFDVELRGVKQCLNLKHPNLLAVHDIRRDATGDSWVVMEFVSGESLEEAIQNNPDGMPPEEAIRWMQGISAGVAYLHDHGIVHRDLKPGNIFSDEGIVKIGDYGLSKFISCSRRSGQTESVGTVHYMAPEIANGRYGKEIDVYALGILLYEMLTGHVPFEGESVGEVLMKHLTSDPELSRLASPYREIVAQAMEKDPEKRYRNAAELAAALPKISGDASGYELPPAVRGARQVVRAQVVEVREPNETAEEPIQAWFTSTARDLGRWWSGSENTLVKVVTLIVAAVLILSQRAWLLPLAMVAGLSYGIYRLIWMLATQSNRQAPLSQPREKATPPNNTALRQTKVYPPPPPQPQARRQERWHGKPARPVAARVVRSPRESLMDLSGGMVIAAIVCLVTSLTMFLLRGETTQPEQYAWLSLVSICGAWLVMMVGRWFELARIEVPFKRFIMLVVGLLLGALAFGVQEMLIVDMPHEIAVTAADVDSSKFSSAFFAGDGRPRLPAYLAYFGCLFLILRWWRLADSGRGTRISLWAVTVFVFWAFALCMLWPFPQPWGAMAIATIAVAVQLGSPWWHPRRLKAQQQA